MQVDILEIISSELVNPSVTTPYYIQLAVVILSAVMALSIDPLLERFFKERMSTPFGRFKFIALASICNLIFVVGTLLLTHIYVKSNYPDADTSYMTCIYQLKSDTEQVTHTTLVPREKGSKCSDIGKSVVRIKTEQSIVYYDTFEIPN